MKLLYKILKPLAVVISGIAAVMIITALLVQDKVAGIILKSLSNDISTKFEIGSVRLSFLRRFPRATLDLKNVLVHSSPGFDRSCFGIKDTDTLLAAKSVIMEFKLPDMIRGKYNIGRIGVRNGSLRILTDTAGQVNYEITSNTGGESASDLIINLDGIIVNDIKAMYDNRATELVISGMMNNGRLKSKISGDNIDFSGKGNLTIDLFTLYSFSIKSGIRTEADVTLNSSKNGIRFEKSTLKFDNNKFSIAGFISAENVLDLSVTGENINLSEVKKYLPGKILGKMKGYNPTGLLNVESKISGAVTRTSNPGIDISFSVQNGKVTYGTPSLAIKDVSFTGFFTNGPKMVPATSSFKIRNFKGTLGSSVYTGSLALYDFKLLRANLELKGKVIPAEIKKFFRLADLEAPEGSADIDLRTSGMIPHKEKYSITDFLALETEGELTFNSFGIGLTNNKIRVDNVTGKLSMSDKITARDLRLTYKGQNLKVDGTFSNLPEWLSGKAVIMTVSASVASDRIVAESFFPEEDKKTTDPETSFSLPEDMILDLSFNFGNLKYKNFTAENVRGTMNYKPRMMNFKTVSLNSLDGVISGDGFFVQNLNRSFLVKGTFNLDKINVKRTFSVFNNFGQSFIRDENLEGILSGSLTILIPMDHLLHPSVQSVTAEGNYYS